MSLADQFAALASRPVPDSSGAKNPVMKSLLVSTSLMTSWSTARWLNPP